MSPPSASYATISRVRLADRFQDMATRAWQGTTYGSQRMHRWLILLLRVIDIRIIYAFAYVFVVPPCLLFATSKPIYHYFRRQWHYGVFKAFLKTYQNHCLFSQIVIDRFAMYAGHRFPIQIEGLEHFQQLESRPEAFVLLSSHIGNYELAGYSLTSTRKRIHALVFVGEKQSVMEHRQQMFTPTNVCMIPVEQEGKNGEGESWNHLFLIDQALQQGDIVSMPADRMLGSQKTITMRLLGSDVRLPIGTFSVAAMRSLDVLAIHVMKSSATKYTLYVKPLKYDKQAPRRQQTQQLAKAYTAELERMLTLYPTQWYNYYDFFEL